MDRKKSLAKPPPVVTMTVCHEWQ